MGSNPPLAHRCIRKITYSFAQTIVRVDPESNSQIKRMPLYNTFSCALQALWTSTELQIAFSLDGIIYSNRFKYLAAELAYLSKNASIEKAEDAQQNIIKLYCSRRKRKDAHGNFRDGRL